ncbi:unnamed protein product [Urochloa humidicola]
MPSSSPATASHINLAAVTEPRREAEKSGLFFQPWWLRRDAWERDHAGLGEGLDARHGPHGSGAALLHSCPRHGRRHASTETVRRLTASRLHGILPHTRLAGGASLDLQSGRHRGEARETFSGGSVLRVCSNDLPAVLNSIVNTVKLLDSGSGERAAVIAQQEADHAHPPRCQWNVPFSTGIGAGALNPVG